MYKYTIPLQFRLPVDTLCPRHILLLFKNIKIITIFFNFYIRMLKISVMAMCYNDSFTICVHHSVLFSLLIFGMCIAESMLFTSVILSLSLFLRLTHKTMSYQHTFVNCQPYIEINSS